MIKGIDVSYANGSVDWSYAKKDIDFAIIRSSFGSDIPSQIDNYFYQNASGCIKNNIPFGTYHFAYFTNVRKAIEEADFAIRLAREFKDYVKFIALDIEEDSERYANSRGAKPDWTECAVVFLERVKAAGFVPVIYTNQSWMLNKLNWSKLSGYKLWYAAPGASSPKYSCAVWQYSWNGRINGIAGNVDMNYCYDESIIRGKSYEKANNTENNTAIRSTKNNKNGIDQLTSSQKVDFTVKVTSKNGINIRSGAAISYKKIGAVPFGTQLKVTRQTAGGGYYWGLINYNGTCGWIALNYTSKISKSIDTIAEEVIRGLWGSGEERKTRLTNAGYDYSKIQARVNELMK